MGNWMCKSHAPRHWRGVCRIRFVAFETCLVFRIFLVLHYVVANVGYGLIETKNKKSIIDVKQTTDDKKLFL